MTQAAVNFLPEDYVEKRAQSRSNIILIGLFVVVMAAVGVAYYFTQGEAVFAELDKTNQEFDDARKRLAQFQEMRTERAQMREKAEVSAMLLERVPRSQLIALLVHLPPRGVSLSELLIKSKELPAPQKSKLDEAKNAADAEHAAPEIQRPPPLEVSIGITGYAPSDAQVAQYIAALTKCVLMRDVNLLYSQESTLNDETVREFHVDMKLTPNADIHDVKDEIIPPDNNSAPVR